MNDPRAEIVFVVSPTGVCTKMRMIGRPAPALDNSRGFGVRGLARLMRGPMRLRPIPWRPGMPHPLRAAATV